MGLGRIVHDHVSRIQWRPIWLATQLYPPNDWKWREQWRLRTGPIAGIYLAWQNQLCLTALQEISLDCWNWLACTIAKKKKTNIASVKTPELVLCTTFGVLDTWRSRRRDLRSAECAGLTTRILHNLPLQSVTGVWNLSKKKKTYTANEHTEPRYQKRTIIYCKVTNFCTVLNFVLFVLLKKCEI